MPSITSIKGLLLAGAFIVMAPSFAQENCPEEPSLVQAITSPLSNFSDIASHVQMTAIPSECFNEARQRGYSVRSAASICNNVLNNDCYVDARHEKYDIRTAAEICQGYIGVACFREARYKKMGNSYNLRTSVDICGGIMSDSCYKEARRSNYALRDASSLCKGTLSDTCFLSARLEGYSLKESIRICGPQNNKMNPTQNKSSHQ